MNARTLLILLLVTLVLVFIPRYRRIGIALSVPLLLLVIWQSLSSLADSSTVQLPQATHQAAPQITQVPVEMLRLEQAELTGTGAPWRLTAVLVNASDMTVNAVELKIERFSCTTATTAFEQCALVWQGRQNLLIKLEPGQRNAIDIPMWSHNPVRLPKGVVRDRFEVLTATSFVQSDKH